MFYFQNCQDCWYEIPNYWNYCTSFLCFNI